MSEWGTNILSSGEIEIYVQNLEPSRVENLGTLPWFESHHRFQKLNQQSAVEALENREECVKDFIITYGKIPVLVHEAICIQIWREKIFSQIIKLKQEPQNTFLVYIILFHEVTAVSLLQNILHHRDSLIGVGDVAVDLIDYCASEIVSLLSEDYAKLIEGTPEKLTNMEEIKSQNKTLSFTVGLVAICIIRYLTEYIDELSLSSVSRLYKTHDVPVLLVNLIQIAPWKRTNPKTNIVQVFDDRVWKNIDKLEGIPRYEAQCWIALRFLLPDFNVKYELTEFRKQHLIKVQKYLTEAIIDQIPSLIELKRYLAELSISNIPSHNKQPLIMETIPEIKSGILKQCMNKWRKITSQHIEMIFAPKKDVMMEVAKRLGETYNLDHLERLVPEGPVCSSCGDAASKRCSKCKNEWYCGRECQVKRWSKHKTTCDIISKQHGEGDKKRKREHSGRPTTPRDMTAERDCKYPQSAVKFLISAGWKHESIHNRLSVQLCSTAKGLTKKAENFKRGLLH